MLKLLLFLLRKALVYARYSHILMKQAKTIKRVQSSTLNEVVTDAISMNPTPTDKGRRLNVFYTTQVANKPPTFVVFVNDVELMHFLTNVTLKIKSVMHLVLKEHLFTSFQEEETKKELKL